MHSWRSLLVVSFLLVVVGMTGSPAQATGPGQSGAPFAFTNVPTPTPAPAPPPPPNPNESPDTAKRLIRAYAKHALENVHSASAVSTILSCLAGGVAIVTPGGQGVGLFLAAWCGGSFFTAFSTAQVLGVDPPDPDYDQVVLTRAPPRRAAGMGGFCARAAGRGCGRLQRAAARYLGAQGRLAAASEALAITSNRFLTAQNSGDLQRQELQRAVAKVHMGTVASALARERTAGRSLARRLRRAGINARLDLRGMLRAQSRVRRGRGIPASLIRRARQAGLEAGQAGGAVANGIDRAIERGLRFDMRSVLARRIDASGLLQQHETITIADLGLIVAGLAQQGVLTGPVAALLNDDLAGAQAAPGPDAQVDLVRKFVNDVALELNGPYSGFLQLAAAPLTE